MTQSSKETRFFNLLKSTTLRSLQWSACKLFQTFGGKKNPMEATRSRKQMPWVLHLMIFLIVLSPNDHLILWLNIKYGQKNTKGWQRLPSSLCISSSWVPHGHPNTPAPVRQRHRVSKTAGAQQLVCKSFGNWKDENQTNYKTTILWQYCIHMCSNIFS